MSNPTLEVLEYQLKRAQGRFAVSRTVMLGDRIKRLEETIRFVKETSNA